MELKDSSTVNSHDGKLNDITTRPGGESSASKYSRRASNQPSLPYTDANIVAKSLSEHKANKLRTLRDLPALRRAWHATANQDGLYLISGTLNIIGRNSIGHVLVIARAMRSPTISPPPYQAKRQCACRARRSQWATSH
jgi:hypothetical protein